MKIVLVSLFLAVSPILSSAKPKNPRSTSAYDSQSIVELFNFYKSYNDGFETPIDSLVEEEKLGQRSLSPRLAKGINAGVIEALKLINDLDYLRKKWERIRALDQQSYRIHLMTRRDEEARWAGFEVKKLQAEAVVDSEALSVGQVLEDLEILNRLLAKLISRGEG